VAPCQKKKPDVAIRPLVDPAVLRCLSGAFEREFQDGLGGAGLGSGLDLEGCRDGYHFLAARTVEVFVKRKERMRLQFTEGFAEFLLDAINAVKESAAIDIHAAAAQFPISAQKKMEFEEAVFFFGQSAPAHKAKIGHVLFVLQAPYRFAVAARISLERDTADVLLLRSTLLETPVAGAKNSAKDAVARSRHSGTTWPEAKAITMGARLLSEG